MPSFTFNNIAFTGKLTFVPLIKGATFTVSQYARMTKGVNADFYGISVAASSSELAVGATNASAVYLYTRNGDEWVDNVTITGTTAIKLGQSVDIGTEWLAVGAIGTGNGTVNVYRKTNGVWGTSPFQTISPVESGTGFGYSVSLSGNTLAIGHRDANSNSGGIQIWFFDGITWGKQAVIAPPPGAVLIAQAQGQRMGWSVYLSGNTVVSGGAGTAGVGNGSVIVSTRTGTTWSAPTVVLPQGSTSGTGFGTSVMLNNGNLYVGAANQNAVYQFTGNGSSWTQTTKMDVAAAGTISDPTTNVGSARAGWSLVVNPAGTVVATGAYNYNPGSNAALGAVYVFENVDGVWGPSAISNAGVSRLQPSPVVTNQRFGWSMTMSGNMIVVGGSGSGTSTAGGAAYTFK